MATVIHFEQRGLASFSSVVYLLFCLNNQSFLFYQIHLILCCFPSLPAKPGCNNVGTSDALIKLMHERSFQRCICILKGTFYPAVSAVSINKMYCKSLPSECCNNRVLRRVFTTRFIIIDLLYQPPTLYSLYKSYSSPYCKQCSLT